MHIKMIVLKIAPVFLLALAVCAEKKIELQDIEEDNLKSEKDKEIEKSDSRSENAQGNGLLPLEFLKSGLLRYFDSPGQQIQQPRYIQQYAVTEPPERQLIATPKSQYGTSAQQTMLGYLSNLPMQLYLVPQYYTDQADAAVSPQPGIQYAAQSMARVAYPSGPEPVQSQTNYIEVPTYVTPSGKAYVQQYSSPVAYLSYTPQPTVATSQATVSPLLAYQVPVVQYPTAIVAPPVVPKGYYQNAQYETNVVDDLQENEEEPQKQYTTQTETPFGKSPAQDYPRYYSSRTPYREDYRHSSISELPAPNPLLLKGPSPHHIPKALPMYRPLTKPVYSAGASAISNAYTPRPGEPYGLPFRRRPNSLLDSYIPSSIQLEYLKRGYTKDPLSVYDALANGRHFHQNPLTPKHYERGFLPNQMYHTGAGGITYGHYKRAPKLEKSS